MPMAAFIMIGWFIRKVKVRKELTRAVKNNNKILIHVLVA